MREELYCADSMETFRFCPSCGGALDSRSLKAGDPDRLVCTQCGFVFYLDPKVAVGTIIDDGERADPAGAAGHRAGYGKWVFPGGYVDRGEPVVAAAVREAREESGLHVELHGLVDIYSYAGRTPIIVVYAASRVSGDLQVDDEGLEARWFAADEVPWDELAFKSTFEGIRDYLAGRLYRLKG